MKITRVLGLSFLLLLLCSIAMAENSPSGILSIDPPGVDSCVAFTFDCPEGQALSGLRWFNNDQMAPFDHVVLMEATKGKLPDLQNSALVLRQIPGSSLSWDHLDLEFPVVSSTGRICAVFFFPSGIPTTDRGIGGGPGMGYYEHASRAESYLSPDGAKWFRCKKGITLAIEPILQVPESSKLGTVALSSLVKNHGMQKAESTSSVITRTMLYPAAPNPFNPRTLIQYDLAAPAEVSLRIYNVRGRLMNTLEKGPQVRGRHVVIWLGIDDRGAKVASGVYFVKFKAAGQEFRQKVTLVR